MFTSILRFLYNLVAVKQYLLFSGLFFVMTAVVMIYTDHLLRPSGCPGPFSLQLAFTLDKFNDILRACGEKGVRYHLIILWIDYIFLLAYSGFLANLVGSLVPREDEGWALKLFSLPVIAGVLDIVENTLLLVLVQNPLWASTAAITFVSLIALIKFLCVILSILVIIYYLYRLVAD